MRSYSVLLRKKTSSTTRPVGSKQINILREVAYLSTIHAANNSNNSKNTHRQHHHGFLTTVGKSRQELHLARKAWHCGMGSFLAAAYAVGLAKLWLLLALGFAFSVVLGFEVVRLKNPAVNAFVVNLFGNVMRHHEVNGISTMPHYIAATMLVVAIFSREIAILSILFLACGDPIASLIGILYGDLGPRRITDGKSLLGTLAGCLVCMSIAFWFCYELPFAQRCIVAFLGGTAGGMAELMPLDWDDNISIPILSALVLWATFILLRISM